MKSSLIFILVLCLAGCSGTGGIAGGLIPLPKFLKGEVTPEGIYISENREFSVRLPHPPNQSQDDKYEWTYTKIQEISNDDNTIIGTIIGPAAFDKNLYHSVIIKISPVKPLEAYVEKIFKRKSGDRKSNLSRISQQQFIHNSKQAFYSAYESKSSYLVLSLVAGDKYFYVVEIDIPKNTGKNLPTREALVNKEWDIFNRIFMSFNVL